MHKDTLDFKEEESRAVLKRFLEIYTMSPAKGIFWDDFRKAISGREESWYYMPYITCLVNNADKEFQEMLANLFYDYRNFNANEELFADAPLYRKAGDDKMADKCIKKFDSFTIAAYTKGQPQMATVVFKH